MIRFATEINGSLKTLWEAWPKQEFALVRNEFEILFGGSRGPGKTATGIAFLLMGNPEAVLAGSKDPVDLSYVNHPNYRALVLRKNVTDMGDWIVKARALYEPLGAQFIVRPPEFRFPSGATIVIGHLDDADSYEKYQGQEFTRIVIEELTQIPSFDLYWKVVASCRSPHKQLRTQVFNTANPSGIGHSWVRERFVAEEKPNEPFTDPVTGLTRIYIPARVVDNPIYANDQKYMGQLMGLSPMMRRAWLEGDWDAISGQYFDSFRIFPAPGEPPEASHVVDSHAVKLEPWYHRWVSCDWGYAHEAAVYKFCQLPNGQIHIYDELVLNQVTPEELGAEIGRFMWSDFHDGAQRTVKLYLSPDAFAKRTEERTVADQIALGVERILGDRSVFIADTSEDVSDAFKRAEVQRSASIIIERAANQRVAGWLYMRSLLRWWPLITAQTPDFDMALAMRLYETDRTGWAKYLQLFQEASEVLPKLQIHGDRCPRLVQAIPLARSQDPDKGDPEDVDKRHFKGMDSIDAARYGLFAHKFMQLTPPFEQFFAEHMQRYAPNGQPDGNSRVWMARAAEAAYKERFGGAGKPIYFNRSRARGQRSSKSYDLS